MASHSFYPILFVLVGLLLLGCASAPPLKTVTLSLGASNFTVNAQVADTPPLREKGLMGRTQMAENEGMLFVYNQSAPRTFWMANTTMPLEILFLNQYGEVVDIQSMAPCSDPTGLRCRLYTSAAPAQYALEVNANFSVRHGLRVGQYLPAPVTS